MDQFDGSDTRSVSGSSVGDGKKRSSMKDGGSSGSTTVPKNSKRQREERRKLAKLANGGGGGGHVARRDSLSKPARDLRDEPQTKRPRKHRRDSEQARRDVGGGENEDEEEEEEEEEESEDSEAAPARRKKNKSAGAAPKSSSSRSDSPMIDFDGLSRPSFGTRARLEESEAEQEARLDRMKGAVRTLLECVGEDPDREGLLATPLRYAKAMLYFTQGYQQNIQDIVNEAIFQEGHNEMVIVKDINIYSMCEHHLVPFTGKMHIGYIPANAVIGISKLPRIAEMFARRLQIQERLTKDVANAIFEVLQPQGVAVVMESSHLCMVMRGVQKTDSTTVTSCVLGCFEKRQKTRNEFLSLVGVNRR